MYGHALSPAWAGESSPRPSTSRPSRTKQNERLKQLSEKTKVPIAEYIRQGIDLVLEREKNHLPGQLTLGVEAR
jgi:hypothetical protein